MTFSEYLNQAKLGEVTFDESWAQGRAGFGGLVAALLYKNMVGQLSDDRPVRSLQIGFVGPVSAEMPFELKSEILREGKSVTHIQGLGVQEGDVQLSILGAFGHSRESVIEVKQERHIFPEHPDDQRDLKELGKAVPVFTQHFDFRYCTALPFEGTEETNLRGFVRFAEAPESIGIPELVALVDAWPPTMLPMLKTFAPASSLSWTIEFIHPQPQLAPDEYCQYEAKIQHTENGYGHTVAKIWNCKGELLALSQQTVTVFG
jgi:acyl-CoA thioesterase